MASSGKSNVDKLRDAKVLDPSQLSPQHRKIIDEDMTDDEIQALIKAHKKIGGPALKIQGDGGGF